MPNFFRFLRSIRLSVGLILLLVILIVIGGIIPQRRSDEFYRLSFPGVSRIIIGGGLARIFTSPLFFAAAGLFFINLMSCSAYRFLKQLRRPSGRKHSPDVIHAGIIILFIGGILTLAGRREAMAFLAPGEGFGVPGGYRIEVIDLAFEKYPDGRPKDWISTVAVYLNGDLHTPRYGIEVNKPLKLGSYRIYQAAFSRERGLTGLKVVYDPGFIVIIIGGILAGGGLFATYIIRILQEDR